MTKALISGFTKSLEELFYVLESQFTPKTTTKEDIIAKTRKMKDILFSSKNCMYRKNKRVS